MRLESDDAAELMSTIGPRDGHSLTNDDLARFAPADNHRCRSRLQAEDVLDHKVHEIGVARAKQCSKIVLDRRYRCINVAEVETQVLLEPERRLGSLRESEPDVPAGD